ncbi:hypothetical protein PIIN_07399 [Serendipita indica DSM 11827]|uniref:BTB domain-containing protein n=1 Tax=Serendipita indica (strain DSM 11827) TaxID=1109443 RepID=G4TQ52_SERID|nr:hypothetical protein PIIN_07399 [Serendipita indica DSM 11827]
MATENMKHSPEFPVGYGEFILISSDNVVFHFPHFLLGHVSPVFRDMFSLSSSEAVTGPPEVKLTEDSATIDHLLRFFDPNKKILPTESLDQMVRLYEAAHKYQVQQVSDWLEREIQIIALSKRSKEFSNPMQVLAVASRYRLPEVARVALRQLISAPSSAMQGDITVGSNLFGHLLHLREQRLRWYIQHLDNWLKDRRQNFNEFFNSCHDCERTLFNVQAQFFPIIALLSSHPSHHTLRQYLPPRGRDVCSRHNTDFLFYPLMKLVNAAVELEKELPNLPAGYH